MNFSTTPPNDSIADRTRAKYGAWIARTSSGSSCSDRAVKPTRSTKRTVMIFRSSASAGAESGSAAAQLLQKRAPAGFSCPQLEQICIGRGYSRAGVRFSRRQKTIAARTAASATAPAAIVIRSRVFEPPPDETLAGSGWPDAAASFRTAWVAALTWLVASLLGGCRGFTTFTPAGSVLPLIDTP